MNTFERLLKDNRNGNLYFHILDSNRELRYGDYRKVTPGKELKAKRTGEFQPYLNKHPVFCEYGMHASKHIQDAHVYRFINTECWVCLVRLWGNVQHGSDKSVGLRRKVVAMRQIKSGDMAKIIKGGKFYKKSDYDYHFVEWVLANPWDGKDD